MIKKEFKLLTLIAIIIGLIIALVTSGAIYSHYKEKKLNHLEVISNKIVILIRNRIAAYEQILKSGVGLFNASDNVSREEWKNFVKDHNLNKNFKGIQGFGYSQVVLPKDKQEHEEKIRKEGFTNFKIYPEGKRDLYTSIIYLEPFDERNQRAFGYDMFSEKNRRYAMQKAIETGNAVMSAKIKLVQENIKDVQAGFLMYLPVYKKGFKLDTIQDRNIAIKGFVYAPFRANDLMNGVLGTVFESVDFELYDGKNAIKNNILYDSNINHTYEKLQKEIKLVINEKEWTLVFKTNSNLKNEEIYIIFSNFIFILILTFVISLLLNSLIRTKENAIDIAQKATEKLSISEERLSFALEGIGDGLWDWNIKTNEVYFSKRWKEMLGFEEDEISNTLEEWKSKVHPDDLENVYKDITAHLEGKTDIYTNEHRVKCKNGSYKWILDRGVIVKYDTDGSPIRIVGAHSDISQRKEIESKLENYMLILDKNIISSITDLNGVITNVSVAFCNISGFSKNELVGKYHNIVRHKDMPDSLYKDIWDTIKTGNTWHGEIKNIKKDGTDYWIDATVSPVKNESGEIINYTSIQNDITDKKRIEQISVIDKLTQLFNRQKLDEIFIMNLGIAKRYNSVFSIIIIDIDYFKSINDKWGHQTGDDILKEFAKILKDNSRDTDIIGRWGGEEFLIICSNTDLNSTIILAEKLRKIISSFKFSFVGNKTASFGISTYHKGDDEKNMIKRADDALYRAKRDGRNKVRVENDF